LHEGEAGSMDGERLRAGDAPAIRRAAWEGGLLADEETECLRW
jgi:hypothetical protein